MNTMENDTLLESTQAVSIIYGINAIKSDIIEFKQLNSKEEEVNFIKNFIQMCKREDESSRVEHESDVYTLLLISAIVLSEIDIVEKILTTNCGNILTSCDSTGYSVISRTLYSGDINILSAVRTYVKSYIKGKSELKLTCNPEDQATILTIMRYPQFEDMNKSVYLEILEPLYSDISKFVELLDTFDEE